MDSSPVIVLYSLQDKWSLKETLVWICYVLAGLFILWVACNSNIYF